MKFNGPTSFLKFGALILGAMMFVSVLVPAPAAEAQYYYTGTPCPHYSIQDVFDDPNSDWDRDRVNNSDELYNGLNPCLADTAAFCGSGGNPLCNYPNYGHVTRPTACQLAVQNSPNGDYDGDGVSNADEVRNFANPCTHPCPHPTNADLALNPNGSWDGDGVSNAIEINQGTNPCDGYVYNPCPYYTSYDVRYMPGYDWDRDGITNADEIRRGYSPCRYNTIIRRPHVTVTVPTKRLPHVTTYVPPAPTPRPVCPKGYPYYHPGTKLCYANPVGGHWR